MEVPALVATGWYDQQIGAIKNFTGLAENAATRTAREHTRLIVGPVDPRRRPVGPQGRRGRLRPGRRARLLRGRRPLVPRVARGRRVRPRGMAPRRAVRDGRQQVAGRGRLAPGTRSRYASFYLHGNGAANTPAGDGALSREAPGRRAAGQVRLRPARPGDDALHAARPERAAGPAPARRTRRRARLRHAAAGDAKSR